METATSNQGSRLMWFAFREHDGTWRVVSGEAEVVDGLYHKLRFPGFETRSGESFGLTATVHVLESIFKGDMGYHGHIQKVMFRDGYLASSVTVGARERIVIGHADDQSLLQRRIRSITRKPAWPGFGEGRQRNYM